MKPEVEIFYQFEAVSKLTRPSEKISVLKKAYEKHPRIFKTIVKLVYQKEKLNVGEGLLKDVPVGDKYTANFSDFEKLAYKAQHRILTGNKLKEVLKEFFSKTDQFTAKWYKRILLKDLRIGVGYNLILQVIGSHERIRSFAKPMKATLIDDISEKKLHELFSDHKWEWEPKFDGFRIFAVIDIDSIRLFSYNGTRAPFLEDILFDELSKVRNTVHKLPVTLDGEVASRNWNESMAFTPNRKNPLSLNEINNLRFYVFDILPVDPTVIQRKSHIVIPLKERKQQLHQIFKRNSFKHLVYVQSHLLKKNQLNIDYLSNLAVTFVKKGQLFDGIVIKAIDSPYEFDKRSKWWIKLKTFKTIDLMCVGVIESNKRPNEIAAIEVMFKGKKVRVSGFKEAEAKEFYEHPELIVGKIVEVKYMSETKDGSLRHPHFVRVRYDKDTPDA